MSVATKSPNARTADPSVDAPPARKREGVTLDADLLVIDDDELMRDSLREALTRRGFRVRVVKDGQEGVALARDENPDVVITDLRMGGIGGLEVLDRVTAIGPMAPPVIVITAYGSVETAVQAIKKGAFDYLTKPFKADELSVVVERAVKHRRLLRENQVLRSELEGAPDRSAIIGASEPMLEVLNLIERYAASPATVLIRGESGTGKELVARAVHFRSARKDRPFLAVNCAALSAGLLESELFGHEKGAFTGADRAREGRFELADGGTLLLDEVTEIEPRLQAKLLRVLQERSFERVGSSRSLSVDVRVLATTNRDIENEVKEGRFREDLFFRLNILPLRIPPLRDRRDDLPLLVEHFLEKCRRRSGGSARRLSVEAMALLQGYRWPGNVRELENLIERAWVIDDAVVVGPELFPGLFPALAPGLAPDPRRTPFASSGATAVSTTPSAVFTGLSIEEMERIMIRDALRRYGGHQKRTAKELGIGVRTLRTKIKKWRLGSEAAGVEGDAQATRLPVGGLQ